MAAADIQMSNGHANGHVKSTLYGENMTNGLLKKETKPSAPPGKGASQDGEQRCPEAPILDGFETTTRTLNQCSTGFGGP